MDSSRQRMKNYAQNIILPGDTGERLKTSGRKAILRPGSRRYIDAQIRDLRAARAAVERHRRRSGFHAPLCSTTFGGSTVPPLFGGGGGGFIQGDIQIGSVGSDYVGPFGGNPAPIVLPAASPNIGDELWQCIHSSGTYANDPNWVQKIGGAGVLFGRFRLLTRTADGTANDDYILPANTLFVTAKQWSLQEFIGGDTWPSFMQQGGFLNDSSTLAWDVSFPPGQPVSMSANTNGDPSKFAYGLFACQDRQTAGGQTISNSPPVSMETIWELAAFAPTLPNSVDTELTIIQFDYKAVSIQYDSYVIGRTPGAPATYAQWNQHNRWEIF